MSFADQDEPSRPRRRRGTKRGKGDADSFDDFWTRESQMAKGGRTRRKDDGDPADVSDLTGPVPATPAGRRAPAPAPDPDRPPLARRTPGEPPASWSAGFDPSPAPARGAGPAPGRTGRGRGPRPSPDPGAGTGPGPGPAYRR